jgi:Mce-associated membrane protein
MSPDDEVRPDDEIRPDGGSGKATVPDSEATAPDEQAIAADEETVAPDEDAEAAEEDAAPDSARSRRRGVFAIFGRVSRGAGRVPLGWRIVSLVVLVLVVAGVGVWDGSLASKQGRVQDTQNAENAAMAAAKTDIEQILSYNYHSLSADLDQASKDTTGEFNSQFAVLASELISPAATQQDTITKATVPDVSVISSTGNQVVVLVFVDQSTTDKTQKKAQANVSQIKATMEDVGGRWLVAQFQAL